jgi:asparagine synthase (glutamine-hydrolysing)
MGAIGAALVRTGGPGEQLGHRMTAAVPHRGTATRVVVHGSCVLSVADSPRLSDAAVAVAGGLAAAFAGRLDNLTELAVRLEHGGAQLASRDPAAVALAAFQAFGEEAPTLLRGMYTVAITDGVRLWAFRDHLGFCPLFYHETPHVFIVATEAKQVAAAAQIPLEPDLEVLERIFYGRLDDALPCAVKGVRRLPKSCIIVADREASTFRRYWHPERLLETARPSEGEIRERFDLLMNQAVSRAMSGPDVVALSGGIDSSLVAAYAAPLHMKRTGRPIGALSAVYPSAPTVDERHYVEMNARAFGMDLHTYEPAARATDRLQEWTRLCDGPVPTASLPQIEENYRLAAGLGYRTMLTGTVAEFVYDMRHHLLTHLLWHGRLGAVRNYLASERARGVSVVALGRRTLAALAPRPLSSLLIRWRGLDRGPRIPDWLDERKVNEVPYFTDLAVPHRRRWLQQQLLAFPGPGLSFEADEVVAAICGIWVRRPVADVDLWEFFLSLPAEIKFPDNRSKTLIRRLLRGKVPDAVLDRTDKTVFNEASLARIDYAAFRRWLVNPQHRVAGVKYDVLARRLNQQDFGIMDYMWAKDLAGIHAFLGLWER